MNEDAVFDADEVIRIGQLEIRYLQPSGQGNHMGAFELRVPPGSTALLVCRVPSLVIS